MGYLDTTFVVTHYSKARFICAHLNPAGPCRRVVAPQGRGACYPRQVLVLQVKVRKTTGLSATGTILPKGILDGLADRLPDTLLGERRDFLGQHSRELTLIGLRGPDDPVPRGRPRRRARQ